MSVIDHLRNLTSGAGRTPRPVPLDEGEEEIERFAACTLFGGLSKVGGELVVTTKQIAFAPWNTSDIAALLRAGLKASHAPGAAGVVVGWIQRQIDAAGSSLGDVRSVSAGSDGGFLRPPSARITTADGTVHDFGVLHGHFEPNFSPRNRAARDRFVALVTSLLG
jgi:hypothetical protein